MVLLAPRLHPVGFVALGLLVAAIVWLGVILLFGSIASDRLFWLMPLWIVVYPFAYYFLSFPREKTIISWDRAVVGVVLLAIIFHSRSRLALLLRDIKVSACFWGIFALLCLYSLSRRSPAEMVGPLRLIVDSIFLPAILCLYAMYYLPIRRSLRWVHAATCVMAISLSIMAGVELLTGEDVLPWIGSAQQLVNTGAGGARIVRVDGPFENSSVLSLVGVLAFFLIVYLRRLMPEHWSLPRCTLHWAGVLAALGTALMPMNRGLILAFAAAALVDYFSRERLVPRRVWLALGGILFASILVARVVYPAIYEDRVASGDNIYARLAQHRQTMEVISDNPLLGVGFNYYHDSVFGDPRYYFQWKGFESIDFPHNSLMTVMAEEGIVGFLFYCLAQVFLLRAMWKIRHVNAPGWSVFLYCFLVYTIFGLDVSTGFYSDLNMWYMFVLGTIFQLQMISVAEARSFRNKLAFSRSMSELAFGGSR